MLIRESLKEVSIFLLYGLPQQHSYNSTQYDNHNIKVGQTMEERNRFSSILP
ncbi:hypothetical protein HMPREF0083_01749 [Aneurinibacillus aneurinilyticus ATCC 12856]|uniref:Uncharacterized protein n=1 Tax=Aneurinibacillus aneurinilyticus ATCC 12856 TaxID=649747 RepID=U1X588_ANEAE|nr:hypothetical protein HMPREF0083_01749 [Aneurinibacillus aneurinilyticus ATCC 12856]